MHCAAAGGGQEGDGGRRRGDDLRKMRRSGRGRLVAMAGLVRVARIERRRCLCFACSGLGDLIR